MMRSLYSGVSGLKVHQTKMDVIGNNISNVNTVGFRASNVTFTDVFYQTSQSASGPNAATGTAGRNAMQIGLGADLASISVNLSGTGATERTDRGLDIMINGDAFFVVNSNGMNYFTKSGSFDIDASGTLYCKTNGATVMGWQVDEKGEIRKDQVSALKVMTADTTYCAPTATTAITLSGNIDKTDKQVQYAADATGYPISVSFYDSLGESYSAKLTVIQDENDPSQYKVSVADITDSQGNSILKKAITNATTGEITYESTGIAVTFGDSTVEYDDTEGKVKCDGIGLMFNIATGAFTSVDSDNMKTINLKLNDGSAANSFPSSGVEIDFSALTMYKSDGTSSVKPIRGDSQGYNAGNAAGKLDGISVDSSGRIYGSYSNGDQKLLGQIAVASFSNPSGLESVGSSMFAATQNSGDFDGIGIEISEVGDFTVGALEMSNVDLATEFTSMITTQRGFQANSRIITTSDSMLEELVNLKR